MLESSPFTGVTSLDTLLLLGVATILLFKDALLELDLDLDLDFVRDLDNLDCRISGDNVLERDLILRCGVVDLLLLLETDPVRILLRGECSVDPWFSPGSMSGGPRNEL